MTASSDPADSLSKADGEILHPNGHALLLLGVAGLTISPFLLDLASYRVNLSVLYLVPLFLLARAAQPRLIVIWTALLLTLTYCGYLLKVVWIVPEPIWSYRLLNRTLTASAIILTSILLVQFARWREQLQNSRAGARHSDPEQEVYEEVIYVVERIVIGAACILYIVTVGVGDLLSPVQYNLPILYSVPIVLCGLTRSRLFLWSVTSSVLILVPAGYLLGPSLTLPANLISFIVTNRAVAAISITCLALFVHVWIGRARSV